MSTKTKIFSGLDVCAQKLRAIDVAEKPPVGNAGRGGGGGGGGGGGADDPAWADMLNQSMRSLSQTLALLSRTQDALATSPDVEYRGTRLAENGVVQREGRDSAGGDRLLEAFRREELSAEIEIKREKISRVKSGEALLKSQLDARNREIEELSSAVLQLRESVEAETECPVCMDRTVSVVLVPCGHLFCDDESCYSCGGVCPTCRSLIVDTTPFYNGAAFADALHDLPVRGGSDGGAGSGKGAGRSTGALVERVVAGGDGCGGNSGAAAVVEDDLWMDGTLVTGREGEEARRRQEMKEREAEQGTCVLLDSLMLGAQKTWAMTVNSFLVAQGRQTPQAAILKRAV